MLDHVTHESSECGYALVATLAAAAAEAVRDEIAAIDRGRDKSLGNGNGNGQNMASGFNRTNGRALALAEGPAGRSRKKFPATIYRGSTASFLPHAEHVLEAVPPLPYSPGHARSVR